VLFKEAMGRFRLRVFPEILALKILPVVPVATALTTPEAMEMVEVPVMDMPVPWVRREEMSENKGAEEPALLKTWKAVPTRVDLKVEPS
jgi:hypothetical protein